MELKSCFGCTERHVGCHSKCERHREEKRRHEEERQKIRTAKKAETDARFVLKQSIYRAERRSK